jgi:hypothetical protein
MSTTLLTRQAEALFASPLQPSDEPGPSQVLDAIGTSLRVNGGEPGCAARLAAEYGEHPEEAVRRMRWALALAAAVPRARFRAGR